MYMCCSFQAWYFVLANFLSPSSFQATGICTEGNSTSLRIASAAFHRCVTTRGASRNSRWAHSPRRLRQCRRQDCGLSKSQDESTPDCCRDASSRRGMEPRISGKISGVRVHRFCNVALLTVLTTVPIVRRRHGHNSDD